MAERIKVMIIDDSAVVRQVVTQALAADSGIEVVGAASDPVFAMSRMQTVWPDVIILDIEMPRMDGITFLKKLMAERPTPTIICSSLAERGASATFAALEAGAVSVITKPKLGLKSFLEDSANDIVQAVRSAARANPRVLSAVRKPVAVAAAPSERNLALERTTDQVIAIGTSTGGTIALESVLTQLPATTLGIVIVQHMPAMFTAMFSERLNDLCQIEVREARHGDRVIPGRALIAPGGKHMTLRRNGAQYVVDVADGPLINRHKPSVDVLFRSVAKIAGANALGIIMTGMGDDGARGMREMHDAGARTIAQDEASCVVFGMPKEAIKLGAVDQVIPLDQIPAAIIGHSARHLKGDS
ncbi:protein-glutamate methylesterase/protein-glutamine glutaminase [Propionivibrio dicarboxylicus]|uniref:Protein-glutamate methylesterase/protein-glutamine glutaminase n=1 Tax=Propionivibrio dicarboxylicus TaxID=83767 RepID=A0A1G8KPT6_9RHOO|nr:chemotaxis response regulator protein-glutamate methylesterase [Propionivibrio dicarboxylicus]SDI45454.1 two-component system, chemotaxis family, response regulator CheB [Propionivibrio dicarboxylicus]